MLTTFISQETSWYLFYAGSTSRSKSLKNAHLKGDSSPLITGLGDHCSAAADCSHFHEDRKTWGLAFLVLHTTFCVIKKNWLIFYGLEIKTFNLPWFWKIEVYLVISTQKINSMALWNHKQKKANFHLIFNSFTNLS